MSVTREQLDHLTAQINATYKMGELVCLQAEAMMRMVRELDPAQGELPLPGSADPADPPPRDPALDEDDDPADLARQDLEAVGFEVVPRPQTAPGRSPAPKEVAPGESVQVSDLRGGVVPVRDSAVDADRRGGVDLGPDGRIITVRPPAAAEPNNL